MQRRTFVKVSTLLALSGGYISSDVNANDAVGKIMTVRGLIDPSQLGLTLPHEHVLVDFVGWENVGPHRYSREDAFEVILPHLQAIKKLGCTGFIECTPAYIGRDVQLLKKLSESTDLHILTNTGYYGARNFAFVPDFARKESTDQLATRWVNEWENGIDESGIRPGFIKTGVNSNELGDLDRKLVRAAAQTHLQTGLTIACHTGRGTIKEQIKIIEEEGLAGDAFIWTHAQNEKEHNLHEYAAKKGCWLSLDGLSERSMDWYLNAAQEMKKRGVLEKVLLSHDAGWYSPGEPGGGNFRGYTLLFDRFIPKLKEAGFTEEEVNQITFENPKQAFTIGVRKQ